MSDFDISSSHFDWLKIIAAPDKLSDTFGKVLFNRFENVVAKEDISLPQCFQKSSTRDTSKCVCMCEKVNIN